MGRNTYRLLKFAITYVGWHTYGKDRATVGALSSLVARGLIEKNEHRQFRIKQPNAITFIMARVRELDIADVREIEAICAEELDRRRGEMAKQANN